MRYVLHVPRSGCMGLCKYSLSRCGRTVEGRAYTRDIVSLLSSFVRSFRTIY
jgi:hypothetical protein